MRKTLLLLGAGALLVILVTPVACNREAIARARADAARLANQRDSLVDLVRQREEEAAALTIRIQTHEAEADRLRDSVIALERRRAAAQLSVREIRGTGELQGRLRTTFPELGDSAWGMTTVPLDRRDTIGIEYLMVPAWFAETFVIDHANAASWRAQKDQLLAVDSLRLMVTALQNSVLRHSAGRGQCGCLPDRVSGCVRRLSGPLPALCGGAPKAPHQRGTGARTPRRRGCRAGDREGHP